jgi:hypothetical protein
MKAKTISRNTGYNVRIINKSLKLLESLQLIKSKFQGNLKVYTLQNNQLISINQITNFNQKIETILLQQLNNLDQYKYINLFKQLEQILDLGSNDILKSLYFDNINMLRKWILISESIYKGSSLFFINNIAQQLNQRVDHLSYLSETNRALLSGSSQSTISRYLNAYINCNYISVANDNVNTPMTLKLNLDYINKGVVTNMDNENLLCPICGKTSMDNRSLGVHIAKTKDPQHNLLSELKKQTNCKLNKLVDLYLEYKEEFVQLGTGNISQVNECSTNECKMNCQECYKNWRADFFDSCQLERKQQFLATINLTKKEVKTSNEIKNNININKEDLNIIKPMRKTPGIDTAPGLVRYFYSLVGGSSLSWVKECSQVKNLLSKGVSVNDIKTTMNYLKRKGSMDLRFLNSSLKDALLEQRYLNEMNNEGTEAYLVKMYYDGMNLPINMQTLVRDVQKVKETMNTGLDYEQTKLVIKYMIDVKCPTINFIGSKRTEALAKMTKRDSLQGNPCFHDRDDMVLIENELIQGRIKIGNLGDQFRTQARQLAKNIFKDNKFVDKYTHFEWAWKIGLDLDEEMYQIGLNALNSKNYVLDNLLNDPNTPQQQREMVLKLKEKFNNWLNEQINKMDLAKVN